MIDIISVINILYDLKINKKKINTLAVEYNIHRNTVRNIKNSYSFSIEEIEMIKHDIDIHIHDRKYIYDKYDRYDISRRRKITNEDIKAIEDVCKKHLNCYLTESDFRYKIYKIQNLIPNRKNYSDVYYHHYTKTEQYKKNNISYGCFYSLAKEFWIEDAWKNVLNSLKNR